MEQLGKRKAGMTREEIVEAMKGKSGGEISRCLEELCDCGFLRRYNMPHALKKGAIYQLIDNYVLFYFEFLRERRGTDEHYWSLSYSSGKINAWRGLAFERLCLWHVPQIRAALGISGGVTDVYSWRARRTEPDDMLVQVDMLLDRGDNMIDLCEMKFTDGEYEIDAAESRRLANRVEVFRRQTNTRKGIRTVLVTSVGLKRNRHSGDIQSVITLDDLFK